MIQGLSGEATMDQAAPKWNRSVRNFEKEHEMPEHIRQIKEAKTEMKRKNLRSDYSQIEPDRGLNNVTPVVSTNFEGNWFDGGYPPDNTMAISNGGYIVTAVNSNIDYYDESGTLLYTSSFDGFFNDPSLTSIIYDPVVLYDSEMDRFFMVVLHGSSSSTSKVLTCFSKSNNPLDGWWVYHLTGDPLGAGNWFDYPKIGVSTNEVFVTGNLFDDNDEFEQAVIYQINKIPGYEGGSINWAYWYDISEEPFTLTPASYGQQGNYGPGLYFVSTDYFTAPQHYRFYNLTDDLGGSPVLEAYSIDADFSIAGDALQLGTDVELDNGDPRGLNAFYLDGIVHFVFNSEFVNDYNGINYNRINVSDLTNWNGQFGLDGFDYSYPSVASFATSQLDKSVMFCFLASGSTIYPQIRVVHCDNDGNWSGSVLVKAGDTYVDNGEMFDTRWGDYTGISRKHDASDAEVWLAAQFGTLRDPGIGEEIHCFDSWIAQIHANNSSAIGDISGLENNLQVYPNPVYDMFSMEFSMEKKTEIEIFITDLNGRLVKLLYRDVAKPGKNLLSFNKGALSSGIYFVTIKTNSNIIKNEKIIVD